MQDGVGIVIPAYQPDPERLRTYVTELHETIAPARLHVELDSPSRAVLAVLDDTPASVRISSQRRGKGLAITAGFEHLDTELLAFADADGSTSPPMLDRVISSVRQGKANLAVGSRRHPDATIHGHQTRVRRHLGDFFARVARHMLPVTLYDYQCGAKAIDRDTWSVIRGGLVSPGFAWDIEVISLVAEAGARIEEVPITWKDSPSTTVPVLGTTSSFIVALLRSYHRQHVQRGSRFHDRIDRVLDEPVPLILRDDLRSQVPT